MIPEFAWYAKNRERTIVSSVTLSVLSSFLCAIVNFAVFHSWKTTPVLKPKLNRDVNRGTTVYPSSLINLGAMSSGPVALFVFKFVILFLTVLSCILMTSKIGMPVGSISVCASV